MNPVFEKSYSVRYHELDYNGNIKALALINFMQDAAGMHAAQLGVAVTELNRQGLTWVLSQLHLIVHRYQRAEEKVIVRTWPSARQGLFTCREFELRDESGNITAKASTCWAVLNLATRKPVRLDKYLPHYPILAQRAIDNDFSSLPAFPTEEAVAELSFRVLRTDLDINQHVNNAIYISWALEAVPDSVESGSMTELEIAFRAEALYREVVLSRCAIVESGDTPCCLHQISNRSDNRELVRLRTRWHNKEK